MVEKQPCLPCKIISVICLCGIGGYMIKLGFNNKPRYVYNLIATVSIGLGIGQIFNYTPFRKHES